jgi:two-component system phosphate regulon response regulator PhoB
VLFRSALRSGADDYITKPFSPAEVAARLRAVYRRAYSASKVDTLNAGDLALEKDSHRVRIGDREVVVTPTEYRLLEFFLSHVGKAYSRSELLKQVWGRNIGIDERAIDVNIRRLRQKLADQGSDALIQTVRGYGYRLSVTPKH